MTNKIYEAFDGIHADDILKASTIEKIKGKRKNHVQFQGLIAACLCIAIIFSGGVGIHATVTEAAYVELDINGAQVGLSLNRFDKVINAQASNEEGTQLLSEASGLRFKHYDSAIDMLILESDMSEGDIVFDVDNPELEEGIMSACQSAAKKCGANARVECKREHVSSQSGNGSANGKSEHNSNAAYNSGNGSKNNSNAGDNSGSGVKNNSMHNHSGKHKNGN